MIRRVFKGRSPYGLVKYLYGEGRRNEHTDAHMIASWDGNPAGLKPEFIEALNMHDVSPLVRQLEQPVKACERAPKQFVYHLVFRNDETDRCLSDDEWAEVCTTAMDRTGIAPEDDPAGCRWIAVRHAEDHVHLVATLAREDGRPPRIWGDYAKLAEVAHEFENKYGLRSTAGRDDNTAAHRPGVKEQVTAEAHGRRASPRVVLRQKVKAAAASSHGFVDFTDRLAKQGISVWPRMSERNPEEITGYSVSLNDWTNAAGEPVRFGGGKLAPDLSWPKLRARWEPGLATERHDQPASGADRHTGQDAPAGPLRGPLTGEEAEQVWREAERIVREAAERISVDAGTDPDAAADAAWAASDTLAAAAAGLEGDAGGPISDAAEAFDRAGRDCYRRVPARSDTGTALRSAGRMMALLVPGTKHPGAQVGAVALALTALVAAVADLRKSQQRLHQAEAAHASADQLRRVAPRSDKLAATDPQRPKNAAELAAMSFSSKPFRVHPATAAPGTRKKDGPDTAEELRRRGGPAQGQGPAQT